MTPNGNNSSKQRQNKTMLESYIRERLEHKQILLMTHIVIGYPSFDDSFEIVRTMVEAGVDLMELQIPFSEPMADGPVILRANQKALESGSTVQRCFEFAENMAQTFSIPFLFMTYANIPYKYGMDKFADHMAKIKLQGAIVPDLPPEEGGSYLRAMAGNRLAAIPIFSPETSDPRMAYLSSFASGFVYCLARKGVTGQNTHFSQDLGPYLARCQQATRLPLAVGFGVKEKADLAFLKGHAQIAVIGSQTIRVVEEKGIGAIKPFIQSLF